MSRIVTKYEPPPIPSRAFDWSACVEGAHEDDPVGFGATENEAIHDLNIELGLLVDSP